MHKISEQAQELIEQIEIQLKKSLPSNEELKTPLRKKDRGEWADAMLNLMFLMDNIIFLECGYTLEHTLRELSEQGGLTSERYRQVEEKSIRQIQQNNSKEELEDLKLAIQEFSNSRQKRVTDFASNATYPDPNQTPYEDPNGKAQQNPHKIFAKLAAKAESEGKGYNDQIGMAAWAMRELNVPPQEAVDMIRKASTNVTRREPGKGEIERWVNKVYQPQSKIRPYDSPDNGVKVKPQLIEEFGEQGIYKPNQKFIIYHTIQTFFEILGELYTPESLLHITPHWHNPKM